VPRRNGRLRLFVRGGATASLEVHQDGPAVANTEAGENGTPATLVLQPGGTLAVRGTLPVQTHLKLERSEWISRAATAAMVSALAHFRRLFSGEVLAPGIALKVGRMAPLFTDLSPRRPSTHAPACSETASTYSGESSSTTAARW